MIIVRSSVLPIHRFMMKRSYHRAASLATEVDEDEWLPLREDVAEWCEATFGRYPTVVAKEHVDEHSPFDFLINLTDSEVVVFKMKYPGAFQVDGDE